MKVLIQSVHFPPSEVLNQRIEKKLKKAFGKYPYITNAHVFLKLQGNEQEKKQIMEIRLHLIHTELFAKTRTANLYKAIDGTIRKLKRQLEKYKQKVYSNP